MGKEGLKIGPSEWMEISQERINTFADATGDHQWIHIDEEKAKHGPFGTTIAHGYLTLVSGRQTHARNFRNQRHEDGD